MGQGLMTNICECLSPTNVPGSKMDHCLRASDPSYMGAATCMWTRPTGKLWLYRLRHRGRPGLSKRGDRCPRDSPANKFAAQLVRPTSRKAHNCRQKVVGGWALLRKAFASFASKSRHSSAKPCTDLHEAFVCLSCSLVGCLLGFLVGRPATLHAHKAHTQV